MIKKLRYAIIGFGGIAENRISKEGFALDKERFPQHSDIELVGATDISPIRRKNVEALGLKWFASPAEILSSNDIDAVFIATNNSSHFSLGKKAIQKQKHLLIEKPIATNLKNAKDLINSAEKKNVSICVDHMMVFNVYNIEAKKLIELGTIGEVNDLVLHMEFLFGSNPEEKKSWRCANPEELGGPIGDVGGHCFYMAEFLTGQTIKSVKTMMTPKTLDINVENGAFIKFKTDQDLEGTIRVSFNDCRGNLENTILNLGYEIYGTKKTIKSFGTLFQLSGHPDEPAKIRLELEGQKRRESIQIKKIQNIYKQIILKHAQSILAHKPLRGGGAFHNLQLILAAYESAQKEGEEIYIT